MVTGRKLLLADDSVTIQKVIDLTFGDEGIEVTTVSNGEQAISMLEELEPDIVLADIFMPGRSGYEVCEHIKRDERFRHIPVVLLVGSFEPFDEAEARRVGADDYLTKPFQSIRQLVNKVTSLLGGGGGGEDEATTRDLAMPEEAKEQEAASRKTATGDIYTADTAPLDKSIEAVRLMERARRAGHESRDDEMIEARPATHASASHDTVSGLDVRPTEPLSPADLEEAGLKPTAAAAPAHVADANHLQETIRDFKIEEMNEEHAAVEPQGSAPANAQYMTRAAAADEALLDLGDIEPPSSTMEADDFILDLQDDAPLASVAEPRAAAAPVIEASAQEAEAAQSSLEVAAHGSADLSAVAAAPVITEYQEVISGVAPFAAETRDDAQSAVEASPAMWGEEAEMHTGVVEETAPEESEQMAERGDAGDNAVRDSQRRARLLGRSDRAGRAPRGSRKQERGSCEREPVCRDRRLNSIAFIIIGVRAANGRSDYAGPTIARSDRRHRAPRRRNALHPCRRRDCLGSRPPTGRASHQAQARRGENAVISYQLSVQI